MGRGTNDLYTSWTPFSDIPIEMGGLLLLENSHKNRDLADTYGRIDVDAYCKSEEEDVLVQQALREQRELTPEEGDRIRWNGSGAYSVTANEAQGKLGGRWLTADYRMGDLLVFSMNTMHAGHDNHTDELRLSTDTRYQLGSEPVDERWIGDNPATHSIRAKRGMVC